MKKLISVKFAGTILLIFLALLTVFHLLILFKVIPANIVWGGQIKDPSSNLFLMELIALLVTFVFIIIIAAKIRKPAKYRKLINVGVWIIFIYFILNIFGNLASESLVEKAIFVPLTLILSFLTFRLAIEK
jgi:FtsH-binding integral membrane protein